MTTETKVTHTPMWRTHEYGYLIGITGEDGACIAVIDLLKEDVGDGDTRPVEEHRENARLIAAAPEILSALIDVRVVCRRALHAVSDDDEAERQLGLVGRGLATDLRTAIERIEKLATNIKQ